METEEEKKPTSIMVEMTEEIKNMPVTELLNYGAEYIEVNALERMGIFRLGQLLSTNTFTLSQEMDTGYGSRYWNVRRAVMKMGLLFDNDRIRWAKAGISPEIGLIPIANLKISSLLKGALTRRASIRYLGDLLTRDYSDIIRIRTIGEDGIIELKRYLHSLGFTLPNEELTFKELREFHAKNGTPLIDEAIGISGRVCGVLFRNGIYTVQDLVDFGTAVFDLVGMGDVKTQKLKEALEAHNIQLNTQVALPKEKLSGLKPNQAETDQAKLENDAIRRRIEKKEKLLSEYEELIKEKSELVEREHKLDKKIATKLAIIQSLEPTTEEGMNHGGK